MCTVVNLLCILCSRIRTYRELLIIFFHDKDRRWYRSEPLFSLEEEEEDAEEVEEQDTGGEPFPRRDSPTSSHGTVTSALPKRPEYEFLLFNYLLQFVHREGQIGDFARAGVLFLMDVAMSPHEPINRLAGEDSGPPPPDTPTEEPEPDPITEAAVALAEYIVDGDFSEVLAAGLAAVYSTLSSKLRVRAPAYARSDGNSMVLGSTPESAAEAEKKEQETGVGNSSDPDFKAHLEHFLRLLEFLQDIIRRNETHGDGSVGDAVEESILDAVRRAFSENVLYPSILECSDSDGSAVAVMSYIEIMLRTLNNGQLGDLLVRFLLSEGDDDLARKRRRSNPRTATPQSILQQKVSQPRRQRKKSTAMAILEIEAPDARRPTDYITSTGRFTLKDLLMTNLRSTNHPAVTAALQLFKTLLQFHPELCTEKLLLVIHDPKSTSYPSPYLSAPSSPIEQSPHGEDFEPSADPLYATYANPDTTYSTSERETSLYLALISRVDPSHTQDAFSTGYDNYLCDAVLSLKERNAGLRDVHPDTILEYKHRLMQNDPVLSLILLALRKFFSNSPELNMALIGVLSTLAQDPCRSLAGWLTFASPDGDGGHHPREFSKEYEADGDDRSIDYRINEDLTYETLSLPATSMDEKSRPLIYAIFHGLVTQLERYRHSVEKFDRYLLERRQGLLFSENLTDALNLGLDFDSTTPIPASPRPGTTPTPVEPAPKPKPRSSFVSFLTPRKSKPKPAPTPITPPSPPKTGRKSIEASPFGPHYQKTNSIQVEPYAAPTPFAGPWMPTKPKKWGDDEDVFSSGWGEGGCQSQRHEQDDVQLITLSMLLDNVVILEEVMKELLAIVHARRALGIDSIRYI